MRIRTNSTFLTKLCLSIVVLLMAFSTVYAQKVVVRGQVTDAGSGEAVIGVNIIEYDAQHRIMAGTVTDVNGNFTLGVSNLNATIVVSFIGYEKQEIPLKGKTSLKIKLHSESTDLKEVVVTASAGVDPLTGIADRNSVSSRVKVDMAQAATMGVSSAGEALQGKVSGVDIMSVSGNPGSGASIVIRGLGSLGNSQPLIVVDGIKQNINIGSGFSFSSADQEDLGSLVNIAPQDIKSIEVLKDAASTAVWGSEGADGVLLIETFKGRKGKTQFSYNFKHSLNIQPPSIPMLSGDEYIMLQLEEWHNARGVFKLPQEIAYDRDYEDFYNYSANTDWIGEITRQGITSDHFFKLQGGGDKTLYYASISYLKDIGTLLNTDFKRITTRVNLNYNISDKLSFTMQFNYTNSLKGGNASPSGSNNIRQMAYRKSPNMSVFEYDSNGELTGEYFTPIKTYQGIGQYFYNPVAIANLSKDDVASNYVGNQFILNYNAFPWLRFRETISLQYQNQKRNRFIPSNAVGATWIDKIANSSSEYNSNSNTLTTRSQLIFAPKINPDHVISGILMLETNQYKRESSVLADSRGPGGNIEDPAANAQIDYLYSNASENKALGVLASLNYVMKDRYLLQMNLRADGSTKFGADQRWGLFPSISAGWRFSSEEFMAGQSIINNGKIRLSYGQSGKQPSDPYVRHAIYNTAKPNQYIENPIIVPTQVQLVKLKWQTVSSLNLGLDMSFFNDRISLTAEVYNKVTSDLLWEGRDKYKIPASSGYANLKAFNAGKVQNKGWELFLNTIPLRKGKQNLSINFNVSRNINTFLKFPENFENERDISIGNGNFPRRADEGVPVGSFYGFRYKGVWPSDEAVQAVDAKGNPLLDVMGNPIPFTYKEEYRFRGGDAIYEDINHDGKIDLLDVVYLGDSNPDFIGSFGINYKWHNFSVSTQFFYRVGYEIVNMVALRGQGMLNKDNQSKAVLRRWREPGQNEPNMLPRAYLYHPANNLGSDRYVEDGSFVRLNNVSISYNLSKQFANRLRMKKIQISLDMRKLMTFTNYSGQDPEISPSGSDPFWFGTDNAKTPPSKQFTLSINVGF